MIKSLFILSLSTLLFAEYTDCGFQNKNYEDVCKRVVKRGVTYNYANKFLLSYFKTKKFDEISYNYLQPQYIMSHRKNEKRANNSLVGEISRLVTHLKKYEEVYNHAEEQYAVNREIVAAILLKETSLGKLKPSHDAFIVFNTLVVRTKPDTKRNEWLLNMGKENMVSIIAHCYKEGLTPDECNLPSSYAGAVGIPQFMPNNFKYARGYETDTPDLSKMEDAIMSASHFLRKRGRFSELIDWSLMPKIEEVESEWYEYEYQNDNTSLVYEVNKKTGKDYNCFTCNRPELQYFRKYSQKIMSYNNSSNYAVGVMRLAYDANRELNATDK